ncbi:MAG: hypothetical protein JRJ87_13290 [Deltaproteobacteria bacterium]|nr:hypothetical protein [Deltaproteobacteria bacterium]
MKRRFAGTHVLAPAASRGKGRCAAGTPQKRTVHPIPHEPRPAPSSGGSRPPCARCRSLRARASRSASRAPADPISGRCEAAHHAPCRSRCPITRRYPTLPWPAASSGFAPWF